tara:strand:- start:68 stop:823 length:756 start_codon:yes stop_codon:yes gene_type:complete
MNRKRTLKDFDQIKALVTGGSSGLGAAIADELTSRGGQVATLDRAPSVTERVLAIAMDVRDSNAVEAGIEHVARHFGGIDVVVNCAGVGAVGDVCANGDEDWRRVLDVNVVGVARVTRAAMPWLRRSKHAAIVNVASAVAHVGVRDRVLYSASKGAVVAMTLAIAADSVGEGIRVNAVSPGTAQTPWVDRLLADSPDPAEARSRLQARQPLGRLVLPEEVAFAVANLASPLSGSVTGTVLHVDGGMAKLRT